MAEAVLTGGVSDAGNTGAGGNAGDGGNSGGAGQAGGGNAGAGSPSGDGGAAATWRDSLPSDLKDNPILSKYSDVGNLAKAYIHAQQQISKKGAIVPGEKATDQEWADFYKAVGVPDADKYTLTPPKDFKLAEPVAAQFKEQALKAGLLPKQANAILEWYAGFEKNSLGQAAQAKQAEQQKGIEALKSEWGESWDKEVRSANLFLKEVGGDKMSKYIAESGLGNDPMVIRLCAAAAKLMGEDKLREGGISDNRMSPKEMQGQIDELRANGDKNGLYDKNHPMHAVTLSKLESLAKQMTGGR